MRLFNLFFLSLLVSGCTHTVTKDKVVEVNIPVLIPCIPAEGIDETQTSINKISKEDWVKLKGDISRKTAIVGSTAIELQNDLDRKNALLAGCSKLP